MLDFEMPEFEWDATAMAVSIGMVILVVGSMVGVIPSVDWGDVPLSTKIMFGVAVGPAMYLITTYMLNK